MKQTQEQRVATAYMNGMPMPGISRAWYIIELSGRVQLDESKTSYHLGNYLHQIRAYGNRARFAKAIELDAPEERNCWHEFQIGDNAP